MAAVGCRNRFRLGQPVGKRSYNDKVNQSTRVTFTRRTIAAYLLFPGCLILAFPAVAQTPVDKLGKLVQGSVVTTTGQPVRDARVEMRDLHGVRIGSSVSDSAGGFKIPTAAESGKYLVLADKASEVGTQWISLDKADLAVTIRLPTAFEGFAPAPLHSTVSAIQLRVPQKAWAHLQSAHQEFSKGNLAGVAREIDRALETDPACAPAFSMKAFLKLAAKDPQGAVAAAEHAAWLDPRDAEAFVALAMAHNFLKEFPQAAEAARHALMLRADSWQGTLEMAKSLYGQGQLIPALHELDEVGKDFPDVHLVRGQVLLSLSRSQDAAEEFGLFLKQEPSDPRSEQIKRIVASLPTRGTEVDSTAR
jgi:Tfp pilus assembly protein PilF